MAVAAAFKGGQMTSCCEVHQSSNLSHFTVEYPGDRWVISYKTNQLHQFNVSDGEEQKQPLV